jgi:hypothetical protein
MGTTLACILYLGHIKLIKYYILATCTVVRSRATGWVFKQAQTLYYNIQSNTYNNTWPIFHI